MLLGDKTILIVGDQYMCNFINFEHELVKKAPKNVCKFTRERIKFHECIYLCDEKIANVNPDVVILYPYLWNLVYIDQFGVLKVPAGHLTYERFSELIVSKTISYNYAWTKKYPNTMFLWCLPIKPIFSKCNTNVPSIKEYDKKFIDMLQEIKIGLMKSEKVFFIDLNKSSFEEWTNNGLMPNNAFTFQFLKCFKEIAYPYLDDYTPKPWKNINERIQDARSLQIKLKSVTKICTKRNLNLQIKQKSVKKICTKRNLNNVSVSIIKEKEEILQQNDNDVKQSIENQSLEDRPSPPIIDDKSHKDKKTEDNNQSVKRLNPLAWSNDISSNDFFNPEPKSSKKLNVLPAAKSISLNVLANLKDALSFLNNQQTMKTDKYGVYRSRLCHLFNPPLWQDLFLEGDEDLALDCLDQCAEKLQNNASKGLQVILITDSEQFVSKAEEKLKPLVERNIIGLNENIPFGAPIILADTPANLQLRLNQAKFKDLSHFSVLIVFGDGLWFNQNDTRMEFMCLIADVFKGRNSETLQKILISQSGNKKLEMVAKNTLQTTFINMSTGTKTIEQVETVEKNNERPGISAFLNNPNLTPQDSTKSISDCFNMCPPEKDTSNPGISEIFAVKTVKPNEIVPNINYNFVQSTSNLSTTSNIPGVHYSSIPHNSGIIPNLESQNPIPRNIPNISGIISFPNKGYGILPGVTTLPGVKHVKNECHYGITTSSGSRRNKWSDIPPSNKSRSDRTSEKSDRSSESTKRSISPKKIKKKEIKLEDIFKFVNTEIDKEKFKKHDKEFMTFLSLVGHDIEKEYATAGRKALGEHESEHKTFKEVPDLHEKYEEKYEFFIEKFKELYGKEELKSKHVQATWKAFWEMSLKYLKEGDWLEKKEGLQKEFMEKYKDKKEKAEQAKRDKEEKERRKKEEEERRKEKRKEEEERRKEKRKEEKRKEEERKEEEERRTEKLKEEKRKEEERKEEDRKKLEKEKQEKMKEEIRILSVVPTIPKPLFPIDQISEAVSKPLFPVRASETPKNKIVFNLSKPKSKSNVNTEKLWEPQNNLEECLEILKIASGEVGPMGIAVQALVTQALSQLPNLKKCLAIFDDKDSIFLLNLAISKFKTTADSKTSDKKEFYLKAAASGTTLIRLAKSPPKDADNQPKTNIDIQAIAKATFGYDTDSTCSFIRNTLLYMGNCSPTGTQVDKVFKEVSMAHFQLALLAD